MDFLLNNSAYLWLAATIVIFCATSLLKKRIKFSLWNPLLITIACMIMLLKCTNTSYDTYSQGTVFISSLLTPATVCLAIPLYEQLHILKHNWRAILGGILAGVFANAIGIWILSKLFRLTHIEYVTLLPKSVTTAIGMAISQELGGVAAITVAAILITGILGQLLAETVFKLFRIHDPVAKGIAIGTSSHAIGTVKAMELGEIEGAMSSLAIAVTGLLTVILSSVFAQFL